MKAGPPNETQAWALRADIIDGTIVSLVVTQDQSRRGRLRPVRRCSTEHKMSHKPHPGSRMASACPTASCSGTKSSRLSTNKFEDAHSWWNSEQLKEDWKRTIAMFFHVHFEKNG